MLNKAIDNIMAFFLFHKSSVLEIQNKPMKMQQI